MGIKKNRVKVDLCSYPPYMILGQRKIGKSTLMVDIAKEGFGDMDKLITISMGEEEGYHHLDGLTYDVATAWTKEEDKYGNRGFIQIVDDIIENNKEYGYKMVALDTFDEMVRIAIEEVVRQSYIETKKPCKSILDAFGGFNRGIDRLKTMLLEQIVRLNKSGLAVFILAHTKMKEKTDPLSGETYEVLTNDLRADIYGFIADKCQMVVAVAIEREIKEGRQIGEKRMMFFRSNGLIECGGRFYGLPEKLELSGANFMKAFEMGVKHSMNEPVSENTLEDMKITEIENNQIKAEQFAEIEKSKEETVIKEEPEIDVISSRKEIQSKFKTADTDTKEKIKTVLNGRKLSEIDSIKDIEEMLSILG